MIKNSILLLVMIFLLSTMVEAMDHKTFSYKLGKLESNNNYQAVNRFNYLGKYQFGKLALIDLGYKDKQDKWLCKDKICSRKDFLDNKEIQEKILLDWIVILKRYLKNKDTYKYIGTEFKGIKVTETGLIAASHLVGAGAVSNMLKSNDVPIDGNGIKATRYLKEFSKE